jgi:4-hydroxy-tetrahydrodipicolinate synthase
VFNLKGSIVALVTPMEANGDISWETLNNLIDWHIDSGTKGIVIVGTTGESATVDVSEHVQLIERAVQHSDGRIEIIAGTGANSTKEALFLTESAKKAGASAALLVTPYYNRPTQKGLLEHYKLIANEVDLAQILYNVPSRTACDLLPETVSELSKEKNIVGLKEASPDPERLEELKASLSDDNFLLYSGDDLTACSFMLQGGHGTISVTANIVPDKISRISELAKDLEKLHENLFIESSPIPVKWALNKMGRIPEGIRLPLSHLDEAHHAELNEILLELNLLD